ncbi:putative enzyme [uncultured Desulfatiglans sp.]|uniref:Putative enzyme n=1 Tax=Uncultured Desulfatiglans sp. TaxID=1748965 RepID=A0A653A2L9_UNCDX|nr:putative enzyme [uncultured Desulfatiglans sp.]
MGLRKGQHIRIEIVKAAFGGRGIGHFEGRVVFVQHAVPGDILQAQVIKKKQNWAEARFVGLIRPSSDRIVPPCPYSGYCGGCQWQHLTYEKQLAYKRSFVSESLAHIGGLSHVTVHEVLPSPARFGYRNKMEFSFSDRPWLLPHQLGSGEAPPPFALGLHVPGTFFKIIDLDSCLLQKEEGNVILSVVKDFARQSGLPAYGLKSHAGFWRFLTVRRSDATGQWLVNLVTAQSRPDAMRDLAKMLAERIEGVTTVVNNIHSGKASVAVGSREDLIFGEGFLEDRIGPYRFRISANSFFQTNTAAAELLYRTAGHYAGLTGKETILDLYSGTGTIPIFLSAQAAQVAGIEINPSAIEDARRNCEVNHIRNCRFLCGDTREILKTIGQAPDVLIVDPPRAGLHQDVLQQILDLRPERLVYVSCNPSTLARDLALLAPEFETLEIQPVDMFPHTYHVESVARLIRRRPFSALGSMLPQHSTA